MLRIAVSSFDCENEAIPHNRKKVKRKYFIQLHYAIEGMTNGNLLTITIQEKIIIPL